MCLIMKYLTALHKLRGEDEDIEEEIQEMKEEAEKEQSVEKIGVWDVITLRDPDWKMPLIICTVLHAGQQLSGINAVSTCSWFFEDEYSVSLVFYLKNVTFLSSSLFCLTTTKGPK